MSLNKQSKILEIGSNDGCLQDVFAKFGIEVLGVEPTGIAAKIAVAKGHSVIQKFFDAKTASQISDKYGKFDLIIANNVLAHVPDINEFLTGIYELLSDEGIVTVGNPSLLSLLEQAQFDTIYHEHFSYLSATAVEFIAKRNRLRLVEVEELTFMVVASDITYAEHHTHSHRFSRASAIYSNMRRLLGLKLMPSMRNLR